MYRLITQIETHFIDQQHYKLCNCSCVAAYLAIQLREFTLAMKIYSMCGEMLLRQKNFKLAIVMYTKLLNAAYTDELERSDFKLYALKQIAFG
jgi:hypothetical protein